MPAASGAVDLFFIVHALVSFGPTVKNVIRSSKLNPVLINDMKEGSYHGYATTDYYTVDPRFGTMEDYLNLSTIAEKNNIKLIKDIIVNHCGLYHWWMEDLPFDDWLNFQEIYLNSTDDTIEQNTVWFRWS